MSIETLNALDPEAYLEHVEATPYPLGEKALDSFMVFTNILSGMLIGPFIHPIKVLLGTCAYLFDYHVNIEAPCLTTTNIKQYCFDSKLPENFEDKLLYIVAKIQELSKKMQIGEVRVVLEKNETGDVASSFRGYKTRVITLGKNSINLGKSCIDLSKEEIEGILAHELSHIKHNDTLKVVIFDWIVVVLSCIAFRHFRFLRAVGITMLVKGISQYIFHAILERHMELAADKEALYYLPSNVGTIRTLHRELQKLYTLKHAPIEELQKLSPTKTIENIQYERMGITPHGNNRAAPVKTTERLAQALNFGLKV